MTLALRLSMASELQAVIRGFERMHPQEHKMNLFTTILNLFKKKGTKTAESHKWWVEGNNAYHKGEAILAEGQFQEALACFDTALNGGYDANGRAYGARASCLQALGFHLDAIDDFSKAIRSEPQDSNLYFTRSISKGATGDLRGCVADIHEAIRFARLHPDANRSYDAYAKEKGYKRGVVGFYESQLIHANLDLERQIFDERIRRENPDFPLGPDLATRWRAESRRRTT